MKSENKLINPRLLTVPLRHRIIHTTRLSRRSNIIPQHCYNAILIHVVTARKLASSPPVPRLARTRNSKLIRQKHVTPISCFNRVIYLVYLWESVEIVPVPRLRFAFTLELAGWLTSTFSNYFKYTPSLLCVFQLNGLYSVSFIYLLPQI